MSDLAFKRFLYGALAGVHALGGIAALVIDQTALGLAQLVGCGLVSLVYLLDTN